MKLAKIRYEKMKLFLLMSLNIYIEQVHRSVDKMSEVDI